MFLIEFLEPQVCALHVIIRPKVPNLSTRLVLQQHVNVFNKIIIYLERLEVKIEDEIRHVFCCVLCLLLMNIW